MIRGLTPFTTAIIYAALSVGSHSSTASDGFPFDIDHQRLRSVDGSEAETTGVANDTRPRLSAVRSGTVKTNAVGPRGNDDVIVYQNTLGEFFYRPGSAGIRIADDLTPIGASCTLTRFVIRVSGGVDGGGGEFAIEVQLYDDCPDSSVGGQPLPHTKRLIYDLDDHAEVFHDLEFDFTDRGICSDQSECQVSVQDCADASACESNPVILPGTFWLETRFNSSSAGIVMGTPPEIGFSEDATDQFRGPCTSWFGGWPAFPHASFWVEVYAEPGCTCESDAACGDVIFCNGSEICGTSGLCEAGQAPCARPDLCHEDSQTCSCEINAHCDDGLFCTGAESCDETAACMPGNAPCAPGEVCDEDADVCLCDSDDDCDDGLYCSGIEFCDPDGACLAGDLPCARLDLCDEVTRECSCENDGHCADGLFCNGVETCSPAAECQPGTSPCPANEVCDEVGDECLCDGNDDCDDGAFCNGTEVCDSAGHCETQFDADCNANGTEDSCDLEQGTSQDCDGNARPDECQTDCDGDGTPDACEVPPFGDLPDCNGNLIPDDCDIAAFHNCCDPRNETGCSNPDIEACVCEADPFCCDTDWDRVCVDEVETLACATCDVTRDCNGNEIPDECELTGRLVGYTGYSGTPPMNFDVNSGAASPFSGMGLRGPGELRGWAYDPHEDVLYASDVDNDLLFSIDPDTGASTLLAALPFNYVRGLAFDPGSRILYGVARYDDVLISVNTVTGGITTVGPLGFENASGLAFDAASGVLIASAGLSLYSIDPATGTASLIEMEVPRGFYGLAFENATTSLYGLSNRSLFVIDLELGTHTLVGELELYGVYGLAFDSSRDTLFCSQYDQFNSQLARIDKNTAATTTTVPLGFGGYISLAFDSSGNTLFGLDTNLHMLLTIDQRSGTGSMLVSVGAENYVRQLTYDSRRGMLLTFDGSNFRDDIKSIDPATGDISLVVSLDFNIDTMAYDSATDTLYVTRLNQLIGIDVATGAMWTAGILGVESVAGLTFDPVKNSLIGVRRGMLLEIDPQTGATLESVELPFSMRPYRLALDPESGRLYSTRQWGLGRSSSQLVVIDRETGGVSFVGQLGFVSFDAWTFDSSSNRLYAMSSGELVTIDPHTGEGATRGLRFGASAGGGIVFHSNTGTVLGVGSRIIHIDPETGRGSERGPLIGLTAPNGLAYDSTTDTLYGVDLFDANLGGWFTIDTQTGVIDLIGWAESFDLRTIAFNVNEGYLFGVTSESGSDKLWKLGATHYSRAVIGEIGFDQVTAITFDPNTNTLYGMDSDTGQLIVMDVETGNGTPIGPVGLTGVSGLAFDPESHTLYGLDSATNQLLILNVTTGTGTHVGPLGFSKLLGLAADPQNGTLFGVDAKLDWLVTLDPISGSWDVIGPLGVDRIEGLAFDPRNRLLYGVGLDSTDADQLVTVDTESGVATPIGPLDLKNSLTQDLAFDPDSGALYGASFGELYQIDVATGAATLIGTERPQRFSALAFLARGAIDCNADFRPDACELVDNDCNGNGLPDECESDADCNANGERDFCDIALGSSPDCNANRTPDECELIENDCNQNSIPDDCELGINDCDGNGVPDECDAEYSGSYIRRLQTRLLPSDAFSGDESGYAVAMDGTIAIIGAPRNDDSGSDTGSAYIFGRGTDGFWHQLKKLVADDASTGDHFGESVSISGDTAVVGSPKDDDSGNSSGAAYVFQRNLGGPDNWGQVAKLTADKGYAGSEFGGSVAIDGDIVVIGARFDGTDRRGAAYVFVRQGGPTGEWLQAVWLRGDWFSEFGQSVAVSRDTVIVGAHLDDAAFVFQHSLGDPTEWTEVARIGAAEPQSRAGYGYAVAIDGDLVAVGARLRNEEHADSGAVYIHERNAGGANAWGEVQKLMAGDVTSSVFGSAVSISDGNVLVGAHGSDSVGSDSGTAYFYVRQHGGWAASNQLLGCDTNPRDAFGISVALSGNTGIVGASGNEQAGDRSGAVYLLVTHCGDGVLDSDEDCDDGNADDQDGCSLRCTFEDGFTCIGHPPVCDFDCNHNGVFDTTDIADATSLDCNENGVPDECETDCNDNQVPDDCDVSAGTSPDCQANGIPDECEADCNDNSIPDDCDVESGTSDDCNGNGTPDECEPDCNQNGVTDSCDIDGGQSEDCNTNLVPDECDIEDETSVDCQSNGVPDECEADCNANGITDDCDVSSGSSSDCNGNGTPDECEVDCNLNEVPDECDLSAGTSLDCNENLTPDECDIEGDTSLDCQSNGTPDECELAIEGADCNGNGVPDDCDITDGVSIDCNRNGAPDSCELSDGSARDCNENAILDECDIDDGTSADCQPNSIPDECDIGLTYTDTSDTLAPFDTAHPQTHVIQQPPLATGTVEITLIVRADLSAPAEYINVLLGNHEVGRLFVVGGLDCAIPLLSDTLLVPPAVFNDAITGERIVIQMIPNVGVDPAVCSQSSVSVTTSYQPFGDSLDCNQNQDPDECDEMGLDFDTNGLIDLVDHDYLVECLGGPGLVAVSPNPWCADACLQGFDADGDGDVDLSDAGVFMRMFAP